jgi:hypothetical protein
MLLHRLPAGLSDLLPRRLLHGVPHVQRDPLSRLLLHHLPPDLRDKVHQRLHGLLEDRPGMRPQPGSQLQRPSGAKLQRPGVPELRGSVPADDLLQAGLVPAR